MIQPRTLAALALALTSAATTAAYAAGTGENDARSIDNARISLTQAVKTAEQQAHGKASRAEYEKTASGWAYDVEVVNDQNVFDVTVDPDNGSVLASTADQVDHDDQKDDVD